jgi:peptidoglycan/LPS O-acetylase OafA/YrhL
MGDSPIAKRIPELPALSGIRFIAASWVFFSHVPRMPGMEWLQTYVFFNLGTFGVSVFFVLSGFILTYNYAGVFEAGVTKGAFGRFLWDRLAKIYPIYLFTLLLCIPIQSIGNHRVWSWPALFFQLTLTQCIYPGQQLKYTDYFNIPAWSISCEMLFYVLAPILIWLALGVKRLPVLLLAAVILWPVGVFALGAPAEHFLWPGRFGPSRVPEFCLGIVTAVCYRRFSVNGRKNWILIGGGLLLIVAGIAMSLKAPAYLANGPLAGPGAAFLIYGLAGGYGFLARWLSLPWIVLLGGSSFSFYLIHDPIIRVCRGIFQHFHLNITGLSEALVVGGVLFVITQALSIVIFKKVELPIQKRLRGLIRKEPANNLASSGQRPCGQAPA